MRARFINWLHTTVLPNCQGCFRGEEIVPTTLITDGKYKKFPYTTTAGRRRLGIEVEASIPIDVYIVQASDLQSWRNKEDYSGISFQDTKLVDAQVNIPKNFEHDWFLILDNTGGEKPAAVHYELFDL